MSDTVNTLFGASIILAVVTLLVEDIRVLYLAVWLLTLAAIIDFAAWLA